MITGLCIELPTKSYSLLWRNAAQPGESLWKYQSNVNNNLPQDSNHDRHYCANHKSCNHMNIVLWTHPVSVAALFSSLCIIDVVNTFRRYKTLNVLCTCYIYSSSMKNGHKGIILIQVDLHPLPESQCLQLCSHGRTVTFHKSCNVSLGAWRRERCILLKDHDQLPILYIPPFFPSLQAYQKHNIMYTRNVPITYLYRIHTYLEIIQQFSAFLIITLYICLSNLLFLSSTLDDGDGDFSLLNPINKYFHGAVLKKLIVAQLVKFPIFYRNPEFHYHVHKSLPLGSILSHMNPIYILALHFCRIHC